MWEATWHPALPPRAASHSESSTSNGTLLAVRGRGSVRAGARSAVISLCRSMVGLALLLVALPVGLQAFRTVVDINQINATEALGAAVLRADGMWFTAVNSPPSINFTQVWEGAATYISKLIGRALQPPPPPVVCVRACCLN